MLKVGIDGQVWHVRFHYMPEQRRTYCQILVSVNGNLKEAVLVSEGTARCRPGENFSRALGRKYALGHATRLQVEEAARERQASGIGVIEKPVKTCRRLIPRAVSSIIWQAYWNRFQKP